MLGRKLRTDTPTVPRKVDITKSLSDEGSGLNIGCYRDYNEWLCSWHTLTFFVVVFFLSFLHVLYISHKLNLLMLSSRLSEDQAWEAYNFLPLFLSLTGLAKCIARAVCGATHVTIVALFCDSSLLLSSNCVWAAEYEAGQSVCTNRNEESTGENCH